MIFGLWSSSKNGTCICPTSPDQESTLKRWGEAHRTRKRCSSGELRLLRNTTTERVHSLDTIGPHHIQHRERLLKGPQAAHDLRQGVDRGVSTLTTSKSHLRVQRGRAQSRCSLLAARRSRYSMAYCMLLTYTYTYKPSLSRSQVAFVLCRTSVHTIHSHTTCSNKALSLFNPHPAWTSST